MKNFDSKFLDLPDYIIKITKEIWEDRGLSTLHQYYGKDIIVRVPATLIKGNADVIASTMATLSEFPDRTLLGEDVIWSGDDTSGYLSSHRIFSQATHLKDGVFGKATGKKLGFRIIADCYCINNQITDEWMIRDQGAVVSQLGLDPKTYAYNQIQAEGGIDKATKPFNASMDIVGPYTGKGNEHPIGQAYADTLQRLMKADFNAIFSLFDRAVQTEYPNGVSDHGHQSVDSFWLGLRSAFPNAEFTIHHVIGRDDKGMADRAAIRWSLEGKHEGWGRYGQPTNAEVYIMGISHVEFGPRGIIREYVTIDDTAIWKQILLHTG
ncbi:nuclear transport factor 2 family protein [Marinomonas sp. 15G1-11]|uniref:Nuclear transport factor 2 family protein n=1 Tax=Marinomonas phaeophyticola TaxID=3004091 RepID=A0ABT4JXF3_9GAMM|nr:nuclear transport factor 2 family protein [Marinomonas sp. 15G1-11]MCZ2722910.1 nuclear transport factor 2 family protein [Marinomonas sp. 15G1-11]